MKENKKVIIGITSLILVMLLIVGLTYAYYRTRIIGNPNSESINVVSKKLGISYSDNNAIITATGIEPGYNNEANPKTFTVHNTGDETSSFNIIIDNVTNTFNKGAATRGEYNDWTYELYSGTTVNPDALLKTGEITTETKQVLVEDLSVQANAQNNYVLIIRYADLTNVDQSDDMAQTLKLRVNIEDVVASDEGTVENPLFNSQVPTLLHAIRTNNNITDNSTGTNIGSAEDDYGTSYYFTGNVTNNYLNYAGMCWRIVRIDGNGNIKIVLADEGGECSANTINLTTSSLINNGETYNIGLYDSTINNWKQQKISDEQLANLIEVEWCQDFSVLNEDKNEWNENLGDLDGDGEDNYYAASEATIYYGHEGTTLKCDMTGLDNSKATVVTGTFGMLTKDEIELAGNYIIENASERPEYNTNEGVYWTYSPGTFNFKDDYASGLYEQTAFNSVREDGTFFADNYDYYSSFRPAVVLSKDVIVTTNSSSSYAPGTYQNPYKVG